MIVIVEMELVVLIDLYRIWLMSIQRVSNRLTVSSRSKLNSRSKVCMGVKMKRRMSSVLMMGCKIEATMSLVEWRAM